MSNIAKKIAEDAVKNIVDDVLASPGITANDALAIINKHIESAYRDISSDEKTVLYRALSLRLHPDKLRTDNPNLYNVLNALGISDEPQKIVNELNAKNLFSDAASKPTTFMANFLDYIIHLINPMKTNLARYYQPFKAIARSAVWILDKMTTLTVVGGVIALVLSILAIELATFITNKVMNFVTGNQYSIELDEYSTENVEQLKKNYINTERNKVVHLYESQEMDAEEIKAMTDDEFYEFILEARLKDEIQDRNGLIDDENGLREEVSNNLINEIKNSVAPTDIIRLKLVWNAFYKVITKPVAEIEGNKYMSLLVIKPLQVLAASIVLTAATAMELARFTVLAAALVAVATGTAFVVSTLALLNSPLYVLDFSRYAINKIMSCVNGNSNVIRTELNDYENYDSPQVMGNLLAIEGAHEADDYVNGASDDMSPPEASTYSFRLFSMCQPARHVERHNEAFTPNVSM